MDANNAPVMPKLFDPATGAPLALPAEQIPDAVAAGKAGFMKGETIPVINPQGQPVRIPAEDSPQAFREGYKLETPELQQERFNQAEYGQGVGNELKAGAAGALRGATLGLSDQALTKSGLVNPETLESLKKYNPASSAIGEVAGIAAPAVATMGGSLAAEGAAGAGLAAADLIPSVGIGKIGHAVSSAAAKAMGKEGAETLAGKILSTAVPRLAGSAVEGAAFGAGNELSEAALGDRDVNAEKLQSSMGLGALIGGAAGTAFLIPETGLKMFLSKEGAHTAAADLASESAAISQPTGAEPTLSEVAAHQGAELPKRAQEFLTPKSLGEISERVKGAKFQNLDPGLPSRETLEAAIPKVPGLQFPVHQAQIDALADAHSHDLYRTIKESGTDLGNDVSHYEALQKKELTPRLEAEIKDIAPGYKPAASAEEAGNRAIEAIHEPYKLEKQQLGPAFKAIDEVTGKTEASQQDVLDVLTKAVPELEAHINVTPEGLKIGSYTSKMGISPEVYRTVKGLVRDIQDGPLSVSDVRKIRDAVSAHIIPTGSAADNGILKRVKSSLMDYMQTRVEASGAEVGIRDTFKRYAQNEEKRELAEYILGGKLNGEGGLKRAIVPEDVLKNIFSDSPTVTAVKEMVGPEKFKQLASDWLNLQKNAFTDKGAFSSARFSTFLRSKGPELAAALGDQAEKLDRIHAITDIMRILPDAPSINPSGTAKTSQILKTLSGIGRLVEKPTETIGGMLHHIPDVIENKAKVAQLNDILKGGAGNQAARSREKFITFKNIEQAASEVTKKISNTIKAFLSPKATGAATRSIIPQSVNYLGSQKLAATGAERRKGDKYAQFTRRFTEIADAVSNPNALSEKIAQNTGFLAQHAPETAQALVQSTARAAQFLYAKAPKNLNAGFGMFPNTQKWQPSDAEIAKWERYVTAVDHPMSVLQDMKQGTLTHEGVETLKTVYPKLYSETVNHLMEELSGLKDELPYQKRLQLSGFFGVSVDQSTTPQFVAMMQTIHGANSQAQPPKGQGMTQSGAKSLQFAENRQTETQALLTRA